jgi:DNA-binding NtrC family response regulator
MEGVDSKALTARAEKIFTDIGARLELGLTLHARSRVIAHDTRASARQLKQAILAFRSCHARRWCLRALCDLAMAYADMSQHEQAMTCLDDARTISCGDPGENKMISGACSRIDSRLSHRLALIDRERPASVDAAFSLLSSRLGASGMCLLKLDNEREPQTVKTWGIPCDVAVELARATAGNDANPVIVTDVVGLLGEGKSRESLGSLLAVRLGKGGSTGLLIACWRRNRRRAGGASPGTSLLVRAYYEICRVVPVLEGAVRPPADALQPICIAGMVTADARLKGLLLSLQRIAEGSANVLIAGETGTGKELVARAIHILSKRRNRPFVVQNCAALPEHLLESELFGHKAGAFTGARGEKKGLLEVASGGTFFLDEVGDVSGAIQAKMLRAIESGEIRRLGDTATRQIDTRFLSATNKNLEAEVEHGRFRRDLYYRLNVVSVTLPPLRDRNGDIEILAHLFLKRFAAKTAKPVGGIADDAMRILTTYDWPGNIRQLENEIEKAVTLVGAGETIDLETLSPCVTGTRSEPGRQARGSLKEELRAVERRRIMAALMKCDWNKTHAAKLLGDISRPALIGKMKRLGIPLKPG